jgi:hypothetical protein
MKSVKEAAVASVSNNNPQGDQSEVPRSTPRERRGSKGRPSPAEIAAEAASIYPDTFETSPSPEEIASEAYAIYQERGGGHGQHDDDWFEAERRLADRKRQQR